MSEGGVGACPQVFVVDSQASYLKMPPERKPRGSQLQKLLLLLVGLAMLGIIVEGFLIYRLFQKTEVSLKSVCDCVHVCCKREERSVNAWTDWKFLLFRISLFASTSY